MTEKTKTRSQRQLDGTFLQADLYARPRLRRRGEGEQEVDEAIGRLELRAVADALEQLVGRLRQRLGDVPRPAVGDHPVAVTPHRQQPDATLR